MFALTALLALAAPLFVRAEVTPSEPGPGAVYNAGATCRVTWNGDTDSTTAWKDMAIQLMTGSNLNMVHITTVATDQDGTVDGVFTYTCPEVTPNSAIYFYQFTAPGADVKTWTTRFTIASDSGQTTPPSNPTQPNSNGGIDNIPWGTGALVDASAAVPPPASAGGTGNLPSGNSTTTAATTSPTSLTSLSTLPATLVRTTAKPLTTTSDADTTTTTANSTSVNKTGGAMTSVAAMDSRVIISLLGLMLSLALW